MITTVKLPNGLIRTADLGGLTGNGFRTASIRMTNTKGRQVRIAGRVPVRHGYDRTLQFQVNMDCKNARSAFVTGEDTETLFVKAA